MDSRRPPVLEEGELRGVLKSVVDALVYLTKERVVHCDIKVENILLTDDFRIVRSAGDNEGGF
jgi:polo-like kinase 4